MSTLIPDGTSVTVEHYCTVLRTPSGAPIIFEHGDVCVDIDGKLIPLTTLIEDYTNEKATD